ncbi:MAG TPA: NAD-dependent epimerase/dehydratase family protein [Acetobacteraceae bacterium]
MTTWLVTGGAGFIGSHLCEALLARGDAVRVLDDLSTGKRENLPAGVTLIEADITDPVAVADALQGVAGCYHLAAIASVQRGIDEWPLAHRVNQGGTIAVLDAVRRMPERIPLVYASSAAVYGDATIPMAETGDCRPLSAYGADKLGCELHARVASRLHAIPTVGLRFFNVYGPRQDPGSAYSGVISIFCERIRRKVPVEVFGDGRQTRDFVYVADAIAALLAAMRLRPAEARVFNVCTGVETSVLDLGRAIADVAGRPLHIQHRPARAGEIRRSSGAPGLSREILGLYEPVGLRAGLRHVLDWLDGAR